VHVLGGRQRRRQVNVSAGKGENPSKKQPANDDQGDSKQSKYGRIHGISMLWLHRCWRGRSFHWQGDLDNVTRPNAGTVAALTETRRVIAFNLTVS
jgi:hypothetical protein